jgi:type VI secretion system protein ImpL
MTTRSTAFLLILYSLLVLGFFYLNFHEAGAQQVILKSVFWILVGIGILLAWLILERILGWWKRRRASAKARPAAAQPPAARPAHDDDATLISLIAEADSRLAQAPGSEQPRHVRDLPLYLLIGPQGAGKTSVIHNAGIDAVLLAGQVLGSGTSAAPTRVANLWLVNDHIFLEISGRVLESDLPRFAEFLRVLAPPANGHGWKIWRSSPPQVDMKGVLLVYDTHAFTSGVDVARIEQSARTIRDRLQQIAASFGRTCPVYAVFTQIDGIPYFADFFARLSEADGRQVFGVLTAADTGDEQARVWADLETKRFSQLFNSLFLSLNARRLLALTHEADGSRKPAIYEFPREFKRIRGPLVQFLVDAFRPDPLKLNPMLRGFFFVGTKKVERQAEGPSDVTSPGLRTEAGSFEPTRIFRPDATQMYAAVTSPQRPAAGRMVDKWLFATDIFQQVLRNDRPPVKTAPAAGAYNERYRRMAAGAAIGFAALLITAWTISGVGNGWLIGEVDRGVETSGRRARDLSLNGLEALDQLRQINVRLEESKPWHLNWGLYTGRRLSEDARRAYFERLRLLVLDDANSRLSERMRDTASGGYDDTYRRLKTQITITGTQCPVDSPLVAGTLMDTVVEMKPDLDETRKGLVRRQLDYYAAELQNGLPVKLPNDSEAEAAARNYLNQSRGPEQVYSALIGEVRKSATKVVVAQQAGDYRETMAAPGEVAFEFTKAGRETFERLAATGKFQMSGEACVLGTAEQLKGSLGSLTQIKGARAIYYRKYKEAWQTFLNACSVRPYRDAADAAAKLDRLSGSSSPLLSLIKFTADNTNFPVNVPQTGNSTLDKVENAVFGAAKKKAAQAADRIKTMEQPDFSSGDVMRVFQPVRVVTPPDANALVNDGNKKYIEALRALQLSMDRYARAPDAEKVAAVQQAQDAVAQATTIEKGLTDGFNKDTDGINDRVGDLLEQPIRLARAWIVDPGKLTAGKKEGERAAFCKAIAPVLNKYPFNSAADSNHETTLIEVSNVFAPVMGEVWKYQQKSLGELTARNGARWDQRPDVQKPRVAPEMLAFLTRAQQLTDVFFPGGSQQPRLQYILRPVPRQDVGIRLEIDGTVMNSKESSIQKTFDWPARAAATPGADAFELGEPIKVGFGKHGGLWGVFRLFQYADERPLNAPVVVWSYVHGEHGEAQPLTPPAKVEFVQFPGGVDLFNPRFFAPLKCPGKAIVEQ